MIRYAIAAIAALVAVGIRLPLDPIVGSGRLTFVPMFAALCFVGWYCGIGPAMLTMGLGALATWVFIHPSPESPALTEPQYMAGLLLNCIFGLLCAFLGVEMKRAAIKAEGQDRMLSETFESIAEAFIRVDGEWRYVYVNEMAEELMRRPRSELLGNVVWDIYPEMIDSEVYKAFHRSVKEKIVLEVEEQHPLRKEWYVSRIYPGADGGVSVYCRNVTQSKREQEAIRISEARYRGLADSGPQMTFVSEAPNGKMLFLNPQFCEFTGKDYHGIHREEVTREIIHEEDWPTVMGRLKSDDPYQPWQGTFRMLRHDGAYRWVECYIVTLKDENGKPFEYVGTIHDVHDQHEMAEAMRRTAEQLKSIADSAPLSIAHCDREHRYLFVNAQYAARLDKQPEELLGKRIDEVLGPEIFAQIKPHVDLALSGQKVDLETEIYYPDPYGKRWVNVLYVPQIDSNGSTYAYVGIILDVTARKQAEEDLRASDDRYRAFIGNSSEGIWRLEFDPPIDTSLSVDEQVELAYQNGKMAELNLVMAQMYGVENPDDLIGIGIEAMLPREVPEAFAYVKSIVESGYRVTEVESQELDTFGNTVYFMNSMSGTIEDGMLLRLWGTQRDVTERKRAENALQEADRRKDEFLATLSHELRNPLAPIANSVELLKHSNGRPELIETIQSTMERSVSHMIRLVDDLLDLSRITQDKIELRTERVELRPILENALELVQLTFDCTEHTLDLALPEEPIYLDADPTRLGQVFGNLLTNARKFTPSGGRIQIEARVEDGLAVVAVRDDGIGIAPEKLSLVFDMFAQIDPKMEKSHNGLGIGLHLVKRLVEMHGGSVSVSSRGLHGGAEFVVSLPAFTSGSQAPKAEKAVLRDEGRGEKVLVVDDNIDAANTISRLLSLYGFETEVAHDGLEAVEKTMEFHPNIILVDIGLPKMNGHEACQEIRRRTNGRNIYIVALTGWGQDEDRKKSEAAGADAHLVKPVEMEKLLQLLSKTVPV